MIKADHIPSMNKNEISDLESQQDDYAIILQGDNLANKFDDILSATGAVLINQISSDSDQQDELRNPIIEEV